MAHYFLCILVIKAMAKVESDPKGNLWRKKEGLWIQLKAPINRLVMQFPVGEYCAALMLLHQQGGTKKRQHAHATLKQLQHFEENAQ
jgi:hypothetical protein